MTGRYARNSTHSPNGHLTTNHVTTGHLATTSNCANNNTPNQYATGTTPSPRTAAHP